MNQKKALKEFSKYYTDRHKKEFPTIFDLCDFKDKKVLEVGAGSEGHFPKEIIDSVKEYIATDISKKNLQELKQKINIKTKTCPAEDLCFDKNTFDIVLSRWSAQHFDNLKKAVEEMCKVSKQNILIIIPSEKGDQTKMKKIKYKDKDKERKDRIEKIKKWLFKKDFKVKTKHKLLSFLFPSVKKAIEIFMPLDFENDLNEKQRKRVKEFLLKRKTKKGIKFTQGACFIYAKLK